MVVIGTLLVAAKSISLVAHLNAGLSVSRSEHLPFFTALRTGAIEKSLYCYLQPHKGISVSTIFSLMFIDIWLISTYYNRLTRIYSAASQLHSSSWIYRYIMARLGCEPRERDYHTRIIQRQATIATEKYKSRITR